MQVRKRGGKCDEWRSFPDLSGLLEDIVIMQLVVINANPQGNDQVAPAKYRVVEMEIAQHIFILAFVKLAGFCMKSSNFSFESLERNRFARVMARRPQESNPMWELWIAV